MELLQAFAPIAEPDARLLILGSMPGVMSLDQQRYYAHPHNQFWPIMLDLLGLDPQLDYEARCPALTGAGIALWDVLKNCRRTGSLDSAIDRSSIVANDFNAFLESHPAITQIAFNGATAERLFRQHVLPTLKGGAPPMLRLPSSSPANAGLSRGLKLEAWRSRLAPILALK